MTLPSKTSTSWLFYFALFLSSAVLLLILAGGLVTSHEAGLAVPDWPLSYGQLMPPMVGNVFWEHGHRMIAGTVGILTLIFAIWIQKAESRGWMKRLGWIALTAVICQALLGGLTVKMMLPPPVSIFHACLAQTFFCLIISMTYFLSPRFLASQGPRIQASPRLFIMTASFVYLQLILGATVRHAHHGVVLHIINAFLVLLHIALSFGRVSKFYSGDKFMVRLGAGFGFLALTQFFLGMGAFIFTHVLERGYAPPAGEVIVTAAHQTTGAVILAISVLLSIIAALG